jgi:flagellar biosynthesis protein FlhB
MSDAGERTEKATPKRMKEAREKGRLGISRDLVAWLGIAAVVATVPGVVANETDVLEGAVLGFDQVIRDPEVSRTTAVLGEVLAGAAWGVVPIIAAAFVSGILATALQGGIHLKRIGADMSHMNPINGLKRMFGLQALWEGLKALLKSAVVALVLVVVVQGLAPQLMSAGALPVANLVATASQAVGTLVEVAVGAGLALAAVDVIVVMRRNRKQTRMTKKEVRDEMKSSEGDPHVRAQRRSRALAMSRSRMISAVERADVVLLNPTHVAVALAYEPGRSAPRVIAKGADEVAARIREKAAEHRIPMVRDIILARALHAACEVDQEIPVELYSAVARVLAFVLALKRRGGAGGVHELRPAA